MDKRVVLAAGLSVAILIVWSLIFGPPPRPVETAPEPAVATGPDAGPPAPAEEPELVAEELPDSPPVEAAAVEQPRFANAVFEVELTNAGARAVSWRLLGEYHSAGGEPLELLPQHAGEEPRFLEVELEDAELAREINGARYQVERLTLDDEGERIGFVWADGRGLSVRKTLTFHGGAQWLVDLELEVVLRGRRLPARLVLGTGFGAQDPGTKNSTYYYANQLVWNPDGGQVDRLKPSKLAKGPGALPPVLRWVGLEDQYFAALVVPSVPATDARWELLSLAGTPKDGSETPPTPVVSVAVPEGRAQLFLGPKNYHLLAGLGHELEKVVWFSSYAFLGWVARFIFFMLVWIHNHTITNYGVAIMLATLLVRCVLFPVNQFSMISMKKTQIQMQRLQPKVKAIRAKYKKKDAETRGKINQEMMDLYKREGINPMGGLSGCLPLLAQFPVLIGFYNMLTVAIELRGAPFFGWIQDLSRPDPYWVTPILMGATMFVQQRMAMSNVKDPAQQQQQKIMMFMPFMFTYICLQMPSGMVLYWFVNNLLGIGQQWLVNRQTSRLETATQKA